MGRQGGVTPQYPLDRTALPSDPFYLYRVEPGDVDAVIENLLTVRGTVCEDVFTQVANAAKEDE